MTHRAQFKDEKLADCFPATWGYYFTKIVDGLHGSGYFHLGEMHIDRVADCLTKLRAMLEKRGDWSGHPSNAGGSGSRGGRPRRMDGATRVGEGRWAGW